MAKEKENIEVDDVEMYVTLTFSNDDVAIIIKNVSLDMLDSYQDKDFVVTELMYKFWFMHTNYEDIRIGDIEYTILNKSKKKIELMVRRNYNE